MNRRLALILGVLIAGGASIVLIPRAQLPVTKATRVFDRRCRGGCMDTALLRVLPTVSPSLIAAGTLTGSKGQTITTTRSSNKSCVASSGAITYLTSNQPCVEASGLLVEPSSTNLMLQSADSSNAAWRQLNATVTGAQAVAPDGTTTMAKLAEDATTNIHFTDQSLTVTTGQPHTITTWLKLGGGAHTWAATIKSGGSVVYQWVNLSTCVLGSQTPGSIVSSYAKAYGSFCRVTTTYNAATITNATSFFGAIITDADGNSSVAGSTGNFLYVGISQTEQQTYSSSYIPTLAGTVTRPADVVSVSNPLSGNSWCVSGRFTPSFGRLWGTPASTLWDIGTDGAANSARVTVDTSGNVTFSVFDNAGAAKSIASTVALNWVQGSSHRVQACNTSGTLSLALDGTAPTSASSGAGTGTFAAQPGSILLGASGSAIGYLSDFCVGGAGSCQQAPVFAGTVACLGDSITAGYTDTISYPDRLAAESGMVFGTTNYGVIGYTAAQIRDTEWTPLARPTKPKQLVILGGINDIKAGTTAAVAWPVIQAIADQALSDGVTVHLVTLLPWKLYPGWTAGLQTETQTFNASLLAYCTTKSLTCVDAYTAMGDTDPAALKAIWSSDGLHPNDAGAQKLADLVRAVLP